MATDDRSQTQVVANEQQSKLTEIALIYPRSSVLVRVLSIRERNDELYRI